MNESKESSISMPFMFAMISQIPLAFHTPDLRNFFSYSIEKESFICFNYRHRPHSSKKFNTCICKVKSHKFDEIINLYDKKNWIDSKGQLMPNKCSIIKIKISKNNTSIENNQLTSEDVNNLLEFKKILDWMPNGNVGTPTKIFIDYINQCIMPQSLISKLGLNIKAYKTHKKKIYSNVPHNYEIDRKLENYEQESIDNDLFATTANGHKIDSNIDDEQVIKQMNYSKKQIEIEENMNKDKNENEDSDGDDDDLEVEEWERHEALYDDVTKQDRTSPYFYENEIELKWEKGGSGLVYYTDDNFWKENEGKDFDAETADDVDVDMSGYYDENGGDKDAQDLIQMRREKLLRKGIDYKKLNNERKINKKAENKIGSFEKYTKGLGRKILLKQGWKEGEPVGNPERNGLKEALDASDGKKPMDKSGLGYVNTKVDINKMIEQQKIKRDKERRSQPYFISSKYDKNEVSDPLLRRFEPVMKYRNNM